MAGLNKTVPKAVEPGDTDARVQRIYDAMFVGDGTVKGEGGLIDIIRDLSRRMEELDEQRDKKLSMTQGFGLAVAGGLLTQSFAFCLHAIKEAMKQ